VTVSSRDASAARPIRAAPDLAGRAQMFLHAGGIAVAASPTAITTVLGSCVSVCLYDPDACVGGMNHFLLPLPVARDRSPRFGAVAMPALVEAVVRAGASRGALVAKVFGGASVLAPARPGRHLGADNVALALEQLETAHIPIVDRDVGGTRGRKVVFLVDEGSAWVRQL
jgi:chemotaxis protein CheD